MYHHIHKHNADDRTQGWLQTCYVAKDAFELLILLPQSPQSWDYKRVPEIFVPLTTIALHPG